MGAVVFDVREGVCKEIALFVCAVFLFTATYACARWEPVLAATSIEIKGKEEMLVAEDIGRGYGVYPVFWCGNNAIVVYNEKIGMDMIDVPSGKRINISPDKNDYPFNCSPDGKWVVYMDRASTRLDEPHEVKHLIYDGKPFEFGPELDVWPVWEGYVADLYRHEVATGKKERFAVVRSDIPSWEVVSPDGMKVFLGSRHNSPMEMSKPKWEAMWFTREDWDWSQTEARWLKDSSGVVGRGHGPNKLFVEIFGEGGWAERFVLDEGIENNIEDIAVDGEGRIYFLAKESGYLPVDKKGKWFMYRCALKRRESFCEVVLERARSIYSYDILPGGDIIFTEEDDNCIRRISPNHTDGECVAGGRHRGEIYLIGISPDGRRLAYDGFEGLYLVEIVR